jgi:hypothetical protein
MRLPNRRKRLSLANRANGDTAELGRVVLAPGNLSLLRAIEGPFCAHHVEIAQSVTRAMKRATITWNFSGSRWRWRAPLGGLFKCVG